MKKQTKQSRKTKQRKDQQRRMHQQAESRLNDWLRTPAGIRARQLRDAALIGALRLQFGDRGAARQMPIMQGLDKTSRMLAR